MTRATIVIKRQADRAKAARWAGGVPEGTEITFKSPRRTVDQNSAMWGWLTALSQKLTWHGQRYSPDDWKDFMMHQLRRARWMPDEEGGMVPIGMRSSDLTTAEMSDLLEILRAFAARHGVELPEEGVAA